MSVDSDNDSDASISNSNILSEEEPDELPSNLTSNFIFDEDLGKLICVGSNFDDIPLSILHEYSLKTKVMKINNHKRNFDVKSI